MDKEEPKKPHAFDQDITEEIDLKSLGYDQQLKSPFSPIGILGLSFSMSLGWPAPSQVLIIRAES